MATRLYITDPSASLVARFTGTTEALAGLVMSLTETVKTQAADLPHRDAEALHEAFYEALSADAHQVKHFLAFGFGRFMGGTVTQYGHDAYAGSTTDPAEIRGIIDAELLGMFNRAGVDPAEIQGLEWG
jgi:hypothetical protein